MIDKTLPNPPIPVSIMPMNNSMNIEMTHRMSKEFVKGRAVWKMVKSAQTQSMKVDMWVRSMVTPAESKPQSSNEVDIRVWTLTFGRDSPMTFPKGNENVPMRKSV